MLGIRAYLANGIKRFVEQNCIGSRRNGIHTKIC